ncbi:DOPA-like domain-containing protein [Catenaria anguillulae PL171]|uniref:DOPA-like domain-containing protein n=1 Tax=Catenaria anguillulae PL171 TaxID=765915 RepID=A0A1Y2HPA8_9FUNG|nr:DOPA-like domain-containing protein [Catenaria anguillulae PL171]
MTSFFTDNTSPLASVAVSWPAPIHSYDVHVYYDLSQYEEAQQLKAKAQELFPNLPQSRMWERPIGPHSKPMWELDIHQAVDFARVVPWFAVNHGNLSVLVHPNTGDMVKDHTENAMWIGERVELDVAMLARAQAAHQIKK